MRYKIQVTVMCWLAAIALAACGNSQATPQPQTTAPNDGFHTQAQSTLAKNSTKIIFLGDSLTAGYGLAQTDAWPEQVQERLKIAGYKTEVVNAGVSGDNSANGLARYDWSVGSANADVLVLALGANDFLQGVSPSKTRKNLQTIIERAQDDGMQVILAGVATPQLERLGPIGRSYAEIYPALAKEYKVLLFPSILDGVIGRPELLQADGLHPTKAGVEIMADNFTKYLRTQLKD
ncbi:MAG: arylesterase [Litorimonas sp.]